MTLKPADLTEIMFLDYELGIMVWYRKSLFKKIILLAQRQALKTNLIHFALLFFSSTKVFFFFLINFIVLRALKVDNRVGQLFPNTDTKLAS